MADGRYLREGQQEAGYRSPGQETGSRRYKAHRLRAHHPPLQHLHDVTQAFPQKNGRWLWWRWCLSNTRMGKQARKCYIRRQPPRLKEEKKACSLK